MFVWSSRLVRAGAVVFTASLLAACDGSVLAPGEITPDASPTSSELPLRSGTAVSKSDVGGIPDSPISSGDVLFFPEPRASDVGNSGGFDPTDLGESRHVNFELSETQLANLSGVETDIGDDGTFKVPVEAGDYLVCLANSWPSHTPGPPYRVVGCDRVELDGDDNVTVSHGESGVQARQGSS